MPHRHRHRHGHDAGRGNLRIAFLLNLAFTIVEIVGGLATNSVAILADAVHDLGDSLSLGFAWWMQHVAGREETERFSYGYRRFSLLGGLVTSLVLVVGSVTILYEAVPRLLDPPNPYAPGMLALAVLGVAVNGAAVLRLKGSHSLNERIVSWHLLEDALGWLAVLVVSVVLLFAEVPVLDPILSVIITSWVLFNVLRNLKQIGAIFLQAVPEEVSLQAIEERIRSFPHVESLHHAHLWSLDGEHNVLSAHVVVDGEATREEVVALKRRIQELRGDFDLAHTTIEIEWGPGDCSLLDESAPHPGDHP